MLFSTLKNGVTFHSYLEKKYIFLLIQFMPLDLSLPPINIKKLGVF